MKWSPQIWHQMKAIVGFESTDCIVDLLIIQSLTADSCTWLSRSRCYCICKPQNLLSFVIFIWFIEIIQSQISILMTIFCYVTKIKLADVNCLYLRPSIRKTYYGKWILTVNKLIIQYTGGGVLHVNRALKSRDYLAWRCEIHAIIGSLGTVRAQPRFRSHVKSMGDFRLLQITVI